MKLTAKQKEDVFVHSAFYLGDGLDKRIKKLVDDYKRKMFGLRFFVDIEYGNFITDILWWREQMKIHLSLARQNKIPEDSFSVQHVKHLLWRIENLELMGVIKAMRLDNPYFGYSNKFKKKSQEEMNRIASEVMEEILEKEKNNSK